MIAASLNHHACAVRVAATRLGRSLLVTLLSVIVIGSTMSLPAGLYHLADSLARLTGQADIEPQISVFMTPESGADDTRNVRTAIAADPDVGSHRFIARDAALRELTATSDLADVIGALDHNPLPDVFVVRASDARPERLERLRARLAALPKVERVQLDTDWARKLAALVDLGREAALVLATVLLCAVLFVIANTIRLQVLGARDEIEVSKLLGANDAFVRRPFLYIGAFQGLIGALVALAIVLAAERFLDASATRLASLYGSSFRIPTPQPWQAAALLGIGLVLGWLAAYISVWTYLRRLRHST